MRASQQMEFGLLSVDLQQIAVLRREFQGRAINSEHARTPQ